MDSDVIKGLKYSNITVGKGLIKYDHTFHRAVSNAIIASLVKLGIRVASSTSSLATVKYPEKTKKYVHMSGGSKASDKELVC